MTMPGVVLLTPGFTVKVREWDESRVNRDRLGRFAKKPGRFLARLRLLHRRRGRTAGPAGTRRPGSARRPLRRGKDLTGDVEALKAIYDNHGDYVFSSADGLLASIAARQGFDGKPHLVDRDEMDRLIADGAPELWRGVGASPDGKTAAEIQDELRRGDIPWFGIGDFGNGFYFTTQRQTAEDGYSDRTPGSVVRATIHPDARRINYRDLERLHTEHMERVGDDWMVERVLSDPGRFAAALGYDVIDIDDDPDGVEQFALVVNRTALIIEEGS